MILGTINGKVTTSRFTFNVTKPIKNFDYVQIAHKQAGYVLCQIVEIIKEDTTTTAICQVIGYKDPNEQSVKLLREPFEPGTEVLAAQDELILSVVQLDNKDQGAYVGKLEGKSISVFINLQKLLTKHIAVLAKSGAGKSYCVGVLLEEIIEKGIPLLIIDPHGEYATLKQKNDEPSDIKRMALFEIEPKGYLRNIQQYGDEQLNKGVRPITISDQLSIRDLLHLFPSKLTATQEGLLYNASKQIDYFTFENLKSALAAEENAAKWQVIAHIEFLEQLGIFSKNYIAANELIQTKRCSVINLRGIAPEIQQIIVYKLLTDLFEQRKKNTIPPFFCVIEEAHNFCPERSFGNAKSGPIIRTIASEGRKFGLGLGIISQRPARVEKSVLSQITTQIILKVTNPNDLKAIAGSVEGITPESVTEIQNLPVGNALITGVVDVPLLVTIRPRKTQHGGKSIEIVQTPDVISDIEQFKDIQPTVTPHISLEDATLASPNGTIDVIVWPGVMLSCQDKNKKFNILIERHTGLVITNIDTFERKKLPDIHTLSQWELTVLHKAFLIKNFTANQFISRSKLSIESTLTLDDLTAKGYLTKNQETYTINPTIILATLSHHSCDAPITHQELPKKSVKAQLSIDVIRNFVSKFVTVTDLRECYILEYREN